MRKLIKVFLVLTILFPYTNILLLANEVNNEQLIEESSEVKNEQIIEETGDVKNEQIIDEPTEESTTSEENTSRKNVETSDSPQLEDEDNVFVSEENLKQSDSTKLEDTTSLETPVEDYFDITTQYKTNESRRSLDLSYDEEKISKSSGTSSIITNGEDNVYYNISVKDDVVVEISTSDSFDIVDTKYDDVIVYNGAIVYSENAYFETIGGYNYTAYMYSSLEETKLDTSGVPISGGGFDGTYYTTVEYENQLYAEILISGFHGYIPLEDIQIIPSFIDSTRSYYTIEDEDFVFYQAVDPLVSEEYTAYKIGEAPENLEEDVKYYSDDYENFSTQSTAVTTKATLTNQMYFMNLPLRSTSNYSGTQYKRYLESIGQTNSQYYNSTNAFVEAQNLYGINSLLLFSMANHESAYGTSYYAKNCFNFFGRSAFDSNPDKACIDNGYQSPRDGIISQSIFLSQEFLNIRDWRYSGSNTGNKSSGINVYYASDPNWGAKIGSMAYNADTYLGGSENGMYKLAITNKPTTVYTSSSLTTPLTTDGYRYIGVSEPTNIDVSYVIPANRNIIITGQYAKASQIQLDTPKNLEKSRVITYTTASKGAYPKYEGSYGTCCGDSIKGNYVENGKVNFANKYTSWYNQVGYISPSSYTVTNDVSIVKPGAPVVEDTPVKQQCSNTVSTVYYPSGKVNKVTKESSDKSTKCETYYLETGAVSSSHISTYFKNGNLYSKNSTYNKTGSRNKKLDNTVYYSSGILKSSDVTNYDINNLMIDRKIVNYYASGDINSTEVHQYTAGVKNSYYKEVYNTIGEKIQTYKGDYYSNGKAKKTTDTRYSGNKKTSTIEKNYDANTVITSLITTNFYSNGTKSKLENFSYNSSGVKTKYESKEYNSSGSMTRDYVGYYHSNSKAKQTLDYRYENNKKTKYIRRDYDTTGSKTRDYTGYYNSYGKGIKTVDYRYSNGIKTNYYLREYDNNSNITRSYDGYYYTNGKAKKTVDYKYSNGIKTSYTSKEFESNGYRKLEYFGYYHSNGQRKQIVEKKYKDNKLVSTTTKNYDTKGNRVY